MDAITRLKTEVSLLEHVRKRLGQEGKKENNDFRFKNSAQDKTPSLLVYGDIAKGYFDFGGKLGGGTIIDFDKNFFGQDEKEVIKNLLHEYKIEGEKREFKKSPMWDDLVDNFENFRCTGGNPIFQRFLGTRKVSIDTMKLYKENLQEVAKEIATIEGLYIEKGVYKDAIVFPEYDEEENIVGVKIRRADGEKLKTKDGFIKSKGHKKVGLLYKKSQLQKDIVYICEGETDYIILKMLGFTSLIGNLGGAGTNAEKIQKLMKDTKKIVCLYDRDKKDDKGVRAGEKAAKQLQEKIGRPIRILIYPEIDGLEKIDMNDLFEQGWREDDFQKLFDEAILFDDYQEKEIEEYEVDKNIYETNVGIDSKNNAYFRNEYVKNELKTTFITNFVIEVIDIFKEEDPTTGEEIEYFMIEITGDGNIKRRGKFRGEEIANLQKFKNKVKSLYAMFLCEKMKNTDLEAIIKISKRPEKYTYSTNNIGYFPEKDCWIFDEGIIKDKVFYAYNNSYIAETKDFKIESLQRKNGIANCIEYIPDSIYNREIKNEVIPVFRHIFGGTQGDLVLGWIISTIFYTPLEKMLTPFPILSITGEKESGKTSGMRIAQKIVGMNHSFIKNWESTSSFVELISAHQTNSLFTPRDEMRNSETSRKKESYLRNRFDRSNEEKGDWYSSSGKRVYKPNSALCVIGEQNTEDPAAFSRLLMIYMKAKRNSGASFEEINIKSDYFPSIIREILEENDFEELKKTFKDCLDASNKYCEKIKGLSPRSKIVYSVPLAGFLFFNSILLKASFEVTDAYILTIQEVVNNKDMDMHSMDNVEDFLGTIMKVYETSKEATYRASLFSTSYITRAKRATDDYGTDVILFDYNSLYDKYVVYKKQIGELPEQRNKLKRKLIDEYEAKESSSKKRGLQEIVTKRVLRIPLKNLEKIDGFLDFIADIDLSQEFEEKTDLPFLK